MSAPTVKHTEENESLLTKKDLRKSWWLWWLFAEVNDSFERLMGLSFCISMIPILKKLYKKKEDFQEALKRHLQFYNTNAIWGSIVHGITIALEEQKAKGAKLPGETVTSIKTGLMGPFAGIGDTIDWATWLPIMIGLFIPLAKSGSWIAGVAPFLIFALITIFEGLSLDRLGYKTGASSATQILKSGMIKQLT
ncbi:PTS system mannose/fructose/sorbose family transporter subunit IID [Sporolactobacillus vineae]|uniref:PTS system mannose/fructose/sorbose family transporter subunit IID n=1 Tax=Sporolactobacillus vineae TaxID=444463 RepID=UPI0002897C2C|nr:PTS system mannose/fructose/sorbose family transporter subunit IID [Sporolactobacillus vineae]